MTRPRGRGLLTRAIETVLVVSHLYARETDPTPPPVADGYRVRRATDADLARIAADMGGELTARKARLIAQRAASADHAVFVAVTERGEVCGFGHTEYGRVADDHLRVDLGETEGVAHLFDDYVAVAHRGRRLQRAIVLARVAEAATQGAQAATILVEASNEASRATVTRAGFAQVLPVVTIRLRSWRRSKALRPHRIDRWTTQR